MGIIEGKKIEEVSVLWQDGASITNRFQQSQSSSRSEA